MALGCIPASAPSGGGGNQTGSGGGQGGTDQGATDQGGDDQGGDNQGGADNQGGDNQGGGDDIGSDDGGSDDVGSDDGGGDDGGDAGNDDPTAQALTIDPREDHVLGNIGAPNEIIEYGQYLCPFCRDFHTSQFAEIEALVDAGALVYTYRHFSPASLIRGLANAAECAGAQDESFFYEFHDLLFRNQDRLSDPNTLQTELEAVAIQVDGLDVDALLECLFDAREDAKVGRDFDLATTLEVMNTPTFFVNGEMVEGNTPVSDLMEFFVDNDGEQ